MTAIIIQTQQISSIDSTGPKGGKSYKKMTAFEWTPEFLAHLSDPESINLITVERNEHGYSDIWLVKPWTGWSGRGSEGTRRIQRCSATQEVRVEDMPEYVTEEYREDGKEYKFYETEKRTITGRDAFAKLTDRDVINLQLPAVSSADLPKLVKAIDDAIEAAKAERDAKAKAKAEADARKAEQDQLKQMFLDADAIDDKVKLLKVVIEEGEAKVVIGWTDYDTFPSPLVAAYLIAKGLTERVNQRGWHGSVGIYRTKPLSMEQYQFLANIKCYTMVFAGNGTTE